MFLMYCCHCGDTFKKFSLNFSKIFFEILLNLSISFFYFSYKFCFLKSAQMLFIILKKISRISDFFQCFTITFFQHFLNLLKNFKILKILIFVTIFLNYVSIRLQKCSQFSVFSSFVLFISSLAFKGTYIFFSVDDPLDSSPIHMGCGIWSVISLPLLKDGGLILQPLHRVLQVFVDTTF